MASTLRSIKATQAELGQSGHMRLDPTLPAADGPVLLSDAQLRQLDVPGPRYTSYPTADRFVEAFGDKEYRQALRQRAQGAVVGGVLPLSVYVHIPFCESLCYYCACNKIITKHHSRGRAHLGWLEREIELHRAELGSRQEVSQLHFGGGSPTFLSDDELTDLMALIRHAFRLQPGAELSIEVDPRTASRQRLRNLAGLGFNRVSFGVQDFDPAVQAAVHRVQPYAMVADLLDEAHALGLQSTNADLIYGLPMQTPASFKRTIADRKSTRLNSSHLRLSRMPSSA